MADTVEGYLAQLKTALKGADPALVQDALYDAEDYLRAAVTEGDGSPEALDAAIESYGTPDEIAAAYRETEVTVARALRKPAPAPASTVLGRFFGVLSDPSAWGSFFYMLIAMVTGIVYFTMVVTGLSLTAGLAVLIIGIPFALLFIATVRAVSLAEGRIVEGLLGERMPRRPRIVGQAGGLWERIKSWFADYRTWTTMLYMLLMLPLGVTYFTIVTVGMSLSLALIAIPFAQTIWHAPLVVLGGHFYLLQWWALPFVLLAGVVGFVTLLWLAKGIGRIHGAFAKSLLVGRTEGEAIAETSATPFAGQGV